MRRRTSTTYRREHVISELIREARAKAGSRAIYVVAENEPQETRLVRDPAQGGHGGDALWNDDYHHTAVVALTGKREAYYFDYQGSAQEFLSCARYGYLYQGQWYRWQKKRRGTPALDLPPRAFVSYLENHDQVANTPFGRRLHLVCSPSRLRAVTALTLLGPATPMLFQGQEFASSSPFLYFADHKAELRGPVSEGRREFLWQFPSVQDPDVQAALPTPENEETFRRCTLNFAERQTNRHWYGLHRDLIALRRSDPVIKAAGRHAPGRRRHRAAGAGAAIPGRRRRRSAADRQSRMRHRSPPGTRALLAPPADCRWIVQWSSEAPRYGGGGTAPVARILTSTWPVRRHPSASEPGPIDDEDGREDEEADVTRRSLPPGSTRRRRSAAAARMARHQRSRRLCVGDRRRCRDSPVSRPADRVAARAARPDGDVQSSAGARPAAGPSGGVARRRGASQARIPPTGRSTSSSSGSSSACRCGGTSCRASTIEKRVLMPYGQNTVHVTYRLLEVHRSEASVRLALRPSIQFRGYEQPSTIAGRVLHADLRDGRYEVCGGKDIPPLRLLIHGAAPR